MANILFSEKELKEALLTSANNDIDEALSRIYTFYNNSKNYRTSTTELCLANELILKAFYIYSYVDQITNAIFSNKIASNGTERHLANKLLNPKNDPSINVNSLSKIDQITLLVSHLSFYLIKGNNKKPDVYKTEGLKGIFEGYNVVFNFPEENVPTPFKNYPAGGHDLELLFDRLPKRMQDLIIYNSNHQRPIQTEMPVEQFIAKTKFLRDSHGEDLLNILKGYKEVYFKPLNERSAQMFANYRYPDSGEVFESDWNYQKALATGLIDFRKYFFLNENMEYNEDTILLHILADDEENVFNSLSNEVKEFFFNLKPTLVKKLLRTYFINNNFNNNLPFEEFVRISNMYSLWNVYEKIDDLESFIKNQLFIFIDRMSNSEDNINNLSGYNRWLSLEKDKCNGNDIELIRLYNPYFFNFIPQQEELINLCNEKDVIYSQKYDTYYYEIKFLLYHDIFEKGKVIDKEYYQVIKLNRNKSELEQIANACYVYLKNAKNIRVELSLLSNLLSKVKNNNYMEIVNQIDDKFSDYLNYSDNYNYELDINDNDKVYIKTLDEREEQQDNSKNKSYIDNTYHKKEVDYDIEERLIDFKNSIYDFLYDNFGRIDENSLERIFNKILSKANYEGILYLGYILTQIDPFNKLLNLNNEREFYDLLLNVNEPYDLIQILEDDLGIEISSNAVEASDIDNTLFKYLIKSIEQPFPNLSIMIISNLDMEDPMVEEFYDKVVSPILMSYKYDVNSLNHDDLNYYNQDLVNNDLLYKLFDFYKSNETFKKILSRDYARLTITNDTLEAIISLFNDNYTDEQYIEISNLLFKTNKPLELYELLTNINGKFNTTEVLNNLKHISLFLLNKLYKIITRFTNDTNTQNILHNYICNYSEDSDDITELFDSLIKIYSSVYLTTDLKDELAVEILGHTNKSMLVNHLDKYTKVLSIKDYLQYSKFLNIFGNVSYSSFRFIDQLAKRYQVNDYVDLIKKLNYLESIGKAPYTMNGTEFRVHDNASAVFSSNYNQLITIVEYFGVNNFDLDYLYFDLDNTKFNKLQEELILIQASIGKHKGNTEKPCLRREMVFGNMIRFINKFEDGKFNVIRLGEILMTTDDKIINNALLLSSSIEEFEHIIDLYESPDVSPDYLAEYLESTEVANDNKEAIKVIHSRKYVNLFKNTKKATRLE